MSFQCEETLVSFFIPKRRWSIEGKYMGRCSFADDMWETDVAEDGDSVFSGDVCCVGDGFRDCESGGYGTSVA